jgi:hypothetical protein
MYGNEYREFYPRNDIWQSEDGPYTRSSIGDNSYRDNYSHSYKANVEPKYTEREPTIIRAEPTPAPTQSNTVILVLLSIIIVMLAVIMAILLGLVAYKIVGNVRP